MGSQKEIPQKEEIDSPGQHNYGEAFRYHAKLREEKH